VRSSTSTRPSSNGSVEDNGLALDANMKLLGSGRYGLYLIVRLVMTLAGLVERNPTLIGGSP
jgi:hypothetical protein